jgi:hypothetical protein
METRIGRRVICTENGKREYWNKKKEKKDTNNQKGG